MTELLYLVIGLLVGGIITYVYVNRTLGNKLTDSLVKNRLLKDEIGKKVKSWSKKPKKKYYGNKKSNG